MPYQKWDDGLYLAKRSATAKFVDHYGVIDVGNRVGLVLAPRNTPLPVLIHQSQAGIRSDWLEGNWEIESKIVDESAARKRIQVALGTPDYDLFGNNCEHFARFIATGERASVQLRTATVIAGLAAVVWLATSEAGRK